MKLLALHLTNVRKFTGKRASITGIGSGITVVSEANEFGKSTFFDAIHALFFEKYSSSGKPVKSLQPYAGGGVEVAADIEADGGTFRVEKRFLSRKSATITRLPDGVVIAQDDEAERWIATLLGGAGDGPAGLLWVRQGLVGLEPTGTKEKSQLMETRRDLLSSVAGEIDAMTGGRRMDRVMRRAAESFSEIATKTGRKSGPWKAAADEAEALGAELATVTMQVQALEGALQKRKLAEAALARLDNIDAKTRRDNALAAARLALEKAQAHVGAVTSARQKRDLAALKAGAAQSDLDAFLAALQSLETTKTQAQSSLAALHDAKLDADQLYALLEAARIKHEQTTTALMTARADLDAARRQTAARKAKAEAAQLEQNIKKAETVLGERDVARAVVKASFATPDWLRRVEAAAADVAQQNATLQAQATTLSMAYDGALRITLNGAPVPENQPVQLDGVTHLDVPNVGRMTVFAQGIGEVAKQKLITAHEKLNELLSTGGVATVEQARTLAAARTEAQTRVNLAQAVLDTLTPNGIETLRSAKADADLAASEAHDNALPQLADLEAQLVQAELVEDTARQAFNHAKTPHDAARELYIKTQAAAQTAQLAFEQATAHANTLAGPEIERADSRAVRLRAQASAQEAHKQAEIELQELVSAAPDLDTARAEMKRAEDAVTAVQAQRAQLCEQLAALSSEIRTLAGNGIEERRDDLAGQLEAVQARETRFARQAAALTRLQIALEAERDAARDTYFGPVQEELKPLLSILHRDAALHFDSESLLPTGLVRDQGQETLDDLSGGTQEQIAILTRLAFARLFARQGRHMPIVLDDALVYSDDDRIIKMFTALTRVAQDQQIIVFSCRQLAFQDLGGARPQVTVEPV
ncbi:AAA family ATPase [Pacificibacter marinus]|uniref:Chromosome partition protein Smc n=1 Tax=Pacificibacter marinus TaxID=658057 RepID=A0A1Y5SAV4_9RHOB|nr:AAA family ATPase [Pacificibacter marinus]SEK48414.1 DNA repair exonuclease SbcCD ATPase subunit [Pacificibacter marinus]SLN36535.1 Chromosome partition protein Smc [Pacificibacter marinus]